MYLEESDGKACRHGMPGCTDWQRLFSLDERNDGKRAYKNKVNEKFHDHCHTGNQEPHENTSLSLDKLGK